MAPQRFILPFLLCAAVAAPGDLAVTNRAAPEPGRVARPAAAPAGIAPEFATYLRLALPRPAPASSEPEMHRPSRLPPAPDSAALLVWAAGSLGAWQLGRASRRLEFWSAGGPAPRGGAADLLWHWTPAIGWEALAPRPATRIRAVQSPPPTPSDGAGRVLVLWGPRPPPQLDTANVCVASVP